MVVVDGERLTLEQVRDVADGASLEVDPRGRTRVEAGRRALEEIARTRTVYGRSTGVGANRDQLLARSADHLPGLALLRSHAGGWGALLPDRTVRAALAIRVNQLLVGASGASVSLLDALVGALDDEALPVVHAVGGIGTGDLTALAEIGLTLLGERPRTDGTTASTLAGRPLEDLDALPLMSSNAVTLARAGLACLELQRLADRAMAVHALSHLALSGNPEALGPALARITPFAGATRTARIINDLLSRSRPDGVDPLDPLARLGSPVPLHVQDFFGLRAFPQVHGPLLDQLVGLRAVIETLANVGSENPAVDATATPPTVTHHGGFHTAYLALAVDATLLALTASAASELSRISHLLSDPSSQLPLFLAGKGAGASGLLIAEYAATAGFERLRGVAAAPSSLGTAHLSASVEDLASHSSAAAARLESVVDDYRHMLAWELVTAVRATRLRGIELAGPLGTLLERCAGMAVEDADHDPRPDLERALAVIDDPDPLGGG